MQNRIFRCLGVLRFNSLDESVNKSNDKLCACEIFRRKLKKHRSRYKHCRHAIDDCLVNVIFYDHIHQATVNSMSLAWWIWTTLPGFERHCSNQGNVSQIQNCETLFKLFFLGIKDDIYFNVMETGKLETNRNIMKFPQKVKQRMSNDWARSNSSFVFSADGRPPFLRCAKILKRCQHVL